MSDRKFLIHEPAYLLLWLGLAVALLATGTATAADGWLLAGQAAVMIALMTTARDGGWFQARLWLPLVALNLTYFWLGDAIPRLREWRADAALWEMDRQLFGDCLAVQLAPSIAGWGRDLLSASYLLFFPLWIGAFVVATLRGRKFQQAYLGGFHLVYAIGFAGYALFPAAGPFRFPPLAERLASLPSGGFLTALNDRIVRGGCNGVDVFPSLHTAITVFVLLSALSLSRRLFAVIAIPCALIITATIGLQYHYVADLAAGALLGASVWWFTVHPFRNRTSKLLIP